MKKYYRVICVALVGVFVLITFCVILPNLPYPIDDTPAVTERAVLEMWHVESFEGGSTSRRDWLLRRATEWEKTHSGSYIHITTYSYEQALTMLNEGESFDIISFSSGIGSKLLDKLQPFDSANVWDNYADSAVIDDYQLALPYMTGAYMLFSRQDVTGQLQGQELIDKCLSFDISKKIGKNTIQLLSLDCGFASNNNPIMALYESGVSGQLTVNYAQTQYNAYERFVSATKSVVLLGTQRDLYRLSNREQQGKISTLNYVPLTSYTDLVQYVGVSKDCEYIQLAQEFCQLLIGDKAQKSLYSTGMFSVKYDDIYTDERYLAVQQSIKNSIVANVFRDSTIIEKERQTALNEVTKK